MTPRALLSRAKNKAQISQKMKNYREENKDKIFEKRKPTCTTTGKKKRLIYLKKCKITDKTKKVEISEKNRDYRQKNKEKISEKMKNYREKK